MPGCWEVQTSLVTAEAGLCSFFPGLKVTAPQTSRSAMYSYIGIPESHLPDVPSLSSCPVGVGTFKTTVSARSLETDPPAPSCMLSPFRQTENYPSPSLDSL